MKQVLANDSQRLIAFKSVVLLLCVLFLCSANAQNASTAKDLLSPTNYHRHIEVMNYLQEAQVSQAQIAASEMLNAAKQQNREIDQLLALHLLGKVGLLGYQLDAAEQALQKANTGLKKYEEFLIAADVNSDLGILYQLQSLQGRALSHFFQALSLYESLGNQLGMGQQHSNIGKTLTQMGQLESALSSYSKALKLQRDYQDPEGVASSLFNMGEIHRRLNQFGRALSYFEQALEIQQQLGNHTNTANTLIKIGTVLREQNQLIPAKSAFEAAMQQLSSNNQARIYNRATLGLAETAFYLGEIEQSRSVMLSILSQALAQVDLPLVTQARLAIARTYAHEQRWQPTIEHAEAGLEELQNRVDLVSEARFHSLIARAYQALEDYAGAFSALSRQKQLEASILSAQRQAALTKLQSELEYIKQEQYIKDLRENKARELREAERRNQQNTNLFASLIVVLLFCFLLFSRHTQARQNHLLRSEVMSRTTELELKNYELQQAYRSLEQMSLRDALTGLYNRHYLEANLGAEIERSLHSYTLATQSNEAVPEQSDLLCYLIDIDDFKHINDTYGHVNGDTFLIQFAQIIRRVFRHSDLQIRWGGEEFLVLCRSTPRDKGAELAERLRRAIAEHHFDIKPETRIHATCSIGFIAYPLDQRAPERLSWDRSFAFADECLYSAKLSGKNCWVGALNAEIRESSGEPTASIHPELGALTTVTSLNHVSAIRWQYASACA